MFALTATESKRSNWSRWRNPPEKPVAEEEKIASHSEITPPVAPQIVDGSDTFITADFIWWKTYIDGMEFAYTGVNDKGFAVPAGASTKKGSTQNPGFGFKPGLKVGLGWHFDHDGWDMVADWTYLYGNYRENKTEVTADSGRGLTSVQSIVLSNGTIETVDLSSAASKWKQDFNVVDLELGRDFFLSRALTMRPHIGFKTAWIHETTKNTLTPIPDTLDGANAISSITLKNTEHMWGIGIRTGFDTGWHITKNWMFYGDLAFTNLWGKFKTSAREINTEAVVGSITTLNVVENCSKVIPVIEAGVGLSYINWFSDNSYRFELRLGWEEQVWLNYNRSQDFIRIGDLTVQGLTVKTMLNF